jgi:hypothetical protein
VIDTNLGDDGGFYWWTFGGHGGCEREGGNDNLYYSGRMWCPVCKWSSLLKNISQLENGGESENCEIRCYLISTSRIGSIIQGIEARDM